VSRWGIKRHHTARRHQLRSALSPGCHMALGWVVIEVASKRRRPQRQWRFAQAQATDWPAFKALQQVRRASGR